MNVPRFTAEASLYRTSRHYQRAAGGSSLGDGDVGPAAPVCGGGSIYYWDWVCTGDGWRLLEVGRRDYSCSYPYIGPLFGKATSCSESDRIVCGGGEDHGQCSEVTECPRPTSRCPPPPEPPQPQHLPRPPEPPRQV
jgi:hypothetical protein